MSWWTAALTAHLIQFASCMDGLRRSTPPRCFLAMSRGHLRGDHQARPTACTLLPCTGDFPTSWDVQGAEDHGHCTFTALQSNLRHRPSNCGAQDLAFFYLTAENAEKDQRPHGFEESRQHGQKTARAIQRPFSGQATELSAA